jgi:putative ABC transport system substrate-binding protein
MKRREFVFLFAGAVMIWPAATRSQQALPLIGFLNSGSANIQHTAAGAYRQGLEETGFIENKNILIESRWAEGDYTRLPELVADLIDRQVTVIMAGGPPAAQAAKKATAKIPVVFTSGDDPVQLGLVDTIKRPGGNLTGVHILFSELDAKKFGLLCEVVPPGGIIAALINSSRSTSKVQPPILRPKQAAPPAVSTRCATRRLLPEVARPACTCRRHLEARE